MAHRKFLALARIGGLGFGAALVSAAVMAPANAAVLANGSFNFNLAGINTVNTTDITATTSSLLLGSGPPQLLITSFVDPYGGKPNNFCIQAGAGCTAAHAPGFLLAGSSISFSNPTLPVGNKSPASIAETITARTDFGLGGNVDVDFFFSQVSTLALTPTSNFGAGSFKLGFQGAIDSDTSGGSYLLGLPADMAITCTQSGLGAAIACTGAISTPPGLVRPAVPEPASLALLSSAVLGFEALRRRKAS